MKLGLKKLAARELEALVQTETAEYEIQTRKLSL